jgi:hypothetical protein
MRQIPPKLIRASMFGRNLSEPRSITRQPGATCPAPSPRLPSPSVARQSPKQPYPRKGIDKETQLPYFCLTLCVKEKP